MRKSGSKKRVKKSRTQHGDGEGNEVENGRRWRTHTHVPFGFFRSHSHTDRHFSALFSQSFPQTSSQHSFSLSLGRRSSKNSLKNAPYVQRAVKINFPSALSHFSISPNVKHYFLVSMYCIRRGCGVRSGGGGVMSHSSSRKVHAHIARGCSDAMYIQMHTR